MRQPYANGVQRSNGPLTGALKALRRARVDVPLALGEAIGSSAARQLVDAVRRAKVRDVRSDVRRSSARGKAYAPAYSARVQFARAPVKPADAPDARRVAILYVLLCSWVGPNGRTGWHLQGHRLNVATLARRLEVGPREVERYVAILQSAGLLTAWQPPLSSGLPRGNRAPYCFALYSVPMTAELERTLSRYHAAWWAGARRALSEAPTSAPTARGPLSASAYALSAQLLSRLPLPS